MHIYIVCHGVVAAGGRLVVPPSHQQLHAALKRYAALIQVVAALEPRALQQLQQQVGVVPTALACLLVTELLHCFAPCNT